MAFSADQLHEIVVKHGEVITTGQALAAGIGTAALRWARHKDVLHSLRAGVYTSAQLWEAASPEARHRLLTLAQQRVHPDLVACGATAAILWELPTPEGPPAQPILTAARIPGTTRGGRGHRSATLGRRALLTPSEVHRMRTGVRVTSRARTVVDCARLWDAGWGLAIADAALARWPGFSESLIAAVQTRPPSPGLERARWVAEHAREEVESPLESLARAAIVRAGLPEPTPQVWVATSQGEYRVDLMDEAHRLITEADGKLKYTDPAVLWQEKRREDALRQADFAVIRFTMPDHHHLDPWLTAYRRALSRTGWSDSTGFGRDPSS